MSKVKIKRKVDNSWQQDGNCSTLDIKLFYPGQGEALSDEVKTACNTCPVQEKCLEHALYHEGYGYWGGTTEKQRQRIRRDRGISMEIPQGSFNHMMAAKETAKKRVKTIAECGTVSGYHAHYRKKEPYCRPCRDAKSEFQREYNASRRELTYAHLE